MGLATSSEVELATVAMRTTGATFGTAAMMNGDPVWTIFLLAVVHFVLLYPLGVPVITNNESLIGYFVTWPLIGVGFALLGMLQFWLFRQAELLPWGRRVAGIVGINLGPKPSWTTLFINTIFWALASVVSVVLYEYFIWSDVILASVLVCVIPAACYILLWVIHMWLLRENHGVMFGSERNIARSILLPGAFHVITNIVLAIIIAVAASTYNFAWIGALVTGIVLFVSTLVIYFIAGRDWNSMSTPAPPRSGDVTFYSKDKDDMMDIYDPSQVESRAYDRPVNVDGARGTQSHFGAYVGA